MQRRVLHAAVVPVDRSPILLGFLRDGHILVMRVHIAQIIPRRASPLGHGVGLALCGAAAARAGGVDPVGHLGNRALAVVGRLIALDLRQNQRQLILGHGHPAALGAGDHRNGLAPVALTGEDPVTELVVDLLVAPALLYCVFFHCGDGLFDRHAIEESGVDHDAGIILEGKGFLRNVAALDDLDDRKAKLRCEIPVALVVARNAHDDTGAVAHEDIVRNEHRNDLASCGVYDLDAVEPDAGLVVVQFAALKVGFPRCGLLIGFHVRPVFDERLPLLEKRVLRGNDGIRHAEERIDTGRVDRDVVARCWS